MSQTNINDVRDQVQEFWSFIFMDEVKEDTLLPGLVDKTYDGELKKLGDTVKVTQIDRPVATRKTLGSVGSDTFQTKKLTTQQIDIVADQRISAAYEFEDLVMLQSQLGAKDSSIRKGLLEAVEIELNNYLYSLIAPSAATPDHILESTASIGAGTITTLRQLAAQAKWNKMKSWYFMADPVYYKNILDDTTLTSADFVQDGPVVGGQKSLKRYGYNIFEDNSDGLLASDGPAITEKVGLAFHPDFLHLVMQTTPTFKLSDLHSNKQFGFVLSVDFIAGAKLGIDGDIKHIQVKGSA